MNLRPALACAALLAAALGSAQAQGVWRCGTDGRQYSDKPCEQGRALDSLQARPAQDVAAAQALARQEQAHATQLVKEREQREAQAIKATAGLRTAQGREPVKPKAETVAKAGKAVKAPRTAKHRPAEDGIWRAVAPSSRQTKG